MSAIKIIQAFAKKSLTKDKGSGITALPSQFMAESKAGEIAAILQQAGIPINQLDDFIRSEADLLKFLNIIESTSKPRVIPGSSAEGKAITEKLFGKKGEVVDMSGKKLDPGKPIIGGTQDDTASGIMTQIDDRMTGINEANKKLGELLKEREIMYGKAPKTKDNTKVKERKMFLEANERLNETENFVTNTITKIKGMEPMTAMKEANSVIGRKGKYKNLTPEESKKILQDTEDHIFERDIPIDPEDMAKGGRAGYAVGNQVTPQVDARMNLDYNTLVDQNEAQRVTQAQNRNPGIMRPTMADVAGAVQTDPRAGIKEAFLNERLSGGERFGDAIPDFDSYGTYTGSDQLLKDYAAAGRGTPSSQLVRLPEGNPYAYSGPGYYEYDGSSFSKTADLNMTPEYEKMIRSNYNLNQINQNTVPRKITQDDIDTANFFGPMYTGFDYSKENNWSPGQPAPDGYRVVDMMGDQFLERMYPSKEEVAGLAGMMPSLIPTSTSTLNPDAGLSGQEYAEKYNIPYASGGRAGYYTGGMVDVEPNLSDIGHGSDALMARTRLVSPDGQATTSTGLNYLLAEDNDNIRVPFKVGGDAGRRAFLKLLASLTGGAAAFKTGILGLGEGGAKKAVTETVKQTAGSGGQVPPYFLNLVSKIKKMGDETLATKDKANAYKYKDYTMEEDFAGNIEITKKGIRDEPDTPEVFMSLKVDEVPLKNKKGSTKVKDYEEFTGKRDYKGDLDVEPGVPDEVVQEGTMFEDDFTDFGKADGGRIGFSAGSLAKLGINSTSRKFLEKVFGKEGFETMIENDPRMHRGMLEVVEMFRNRDKEGLKMYLQKFLPHMDDATVEDFIVGSGDSSGIRGQLIRLGSGREYKNLMDLKKQADNVRKLEDFDIEDVSKNAEGGRIGLFLGGGLTAGKGLAREMLKFMTKGSSNAKSPAEILKMMNPKQFEKLLDNPAMLGKISPQTGQSANEMIIEMIKKTKDDRSSMVGDLIGSARKIKKVDDSVIAYKKKIIKDMIDGGIDEDTAYAFAEKMAKEMKEAAAPQLTSSPPKITEQGLLELENIQKNLMTKDRKLQATGGLTTMLGE